MPDTAQTVPPFIPGLVIVALLIIVSILIGWRNYVRRMNPHLIPGMDEWEFYEGEVMEGGSRKPEKPKLWEVGIGGRAVDEKKFAESGWEWIQPLSAMSLNPEPAAVGTPLTSPGPGSQTPSHVPSRFHRLKLFSSSAKAPPPRSVSPPPVPLNRLQVSVLISMPSLSSRIGSPSRHSSAQLPVLPNPDRSEEQHTKDNHVNVDDEEEGAPDVAFGVVVLPWQRAEDDDEVGQTTISVI